MPDGEVELCCVGADLVGDVEARRPVSYYHDFLVREDLWNRVAECSVTDYYIIDKFPLSVRPFYTMPDAKDPVRAATRPLGLLCLPFQPSCRS